MSLPCLDMNKWSEAVDEPGRRNQIDLLTLEMHGILMSSGFLQDRDIAGISMGGHILLCCVQWAVPLHKRHMPDHFACRSCSLSHWKLGWGNYCKNPRALTSNLSVTPRISNPIFLAVLVCSYHYWLEVKLPPSPFSGMRCQQAEENRPASYPKHFGLHSSASARGL